MRSRHLSRALWDIDKAAEAAKLDGKTDFYYGIIAAKKILLAARENEIQQRDLRREKRRKNLAERA